MKRKCYGDGKLIKISRRKFWFGAVAIDSNINSAGVTITSTDSNTRLKVEGGTPCGKGEYLMKREHSSNTDEVLVAKNQGKLNVINQ